MPFIVIEGLDGAGKSTQVAMLSRLLEQQGQSFEYLHFPRFDAPVYGELIARFLRGELGALESVDPYLVALLFAGDRAGAAAMVGGWLDEGKWVVTDRYVYSNVAYQCAKIADACKRNALREWIVALEYDYNRIPRPDVSIFLDVPFAFTTERLRAAREGNDRAYLGGGRDIHEESLDLQRRVREVYMDCAATDGGLRVVDCSDGAGGMDTPEHIFEHICREVNINLPSHERR